MRPVTALVVVSFMMISQVRKINNFRGVAIPSFPTFVLMPFTYSIANGINPGSIAFGLFIRAIEGRARESDTRSCGSLQGRSCSSSALEPLNRPWECSLFRT